MASCWIVTDGKVGMESQCLGLAEFLGLDAALKRVALRPPWALVAPFLRPAIAHGYTRTSDPLEPPWPDLLIASGRQSVPASIFVRQMSRRTGSRSVTVQIQNPVISPRHFDLVITPDHDRLGGRNVLTTRGALHRVTPQKLAEAAPGFLERIRHLPRPYVAVLLGGANGVFQFSGQQMQQLAEALAADLRRSGGSMLITPSRRTGDANVALLQQILGDLPALIWDGTGANPYFGMLAVADRVVVTGDSVNMVSEAVASGKPVQVFALPGGSAKFSQFHATLRAQGLTSPFPGPLPIHSTGAPSDMERAAAAVREVYLKIRGAPL